MKQNITKASVYTKLDENANKDNCSDYLYRPFIKANLWNYKPMIMRTYQMPQLFPTPKHENIVIVVPGIGNSKEYLPLISNKICDLGFNEACQCFPLYYYTEQKTERDGDLFAEEMPKQVRHDRAARRWT